MVQSKQEYKYFLECDRLALGITRKQPKLFGDEIWKFERCMRKVDYLSGQASPIAKISNLLGRLKYHRLSLKLGFSIPCNVCGPGLAIVHYGTIVISADATVGANCRMHAGVNIGASGGYRK